MAEFEGAPRLRAIIEGLRQKSFHPPLHYWLLSLWCQWFGYSLEIARAFSIICSIGTILALYLLLRTAGIDNPLLPTLVYALSSGAVYYGQEARHYALSSLFITSSALFAYLAYQSASLNMKRVAIYAMAMAVCAGLAFQTHYLSIIPIFVILSWVVINHWPDSRPIAITAPLVALGIVVLGIPTFLMQVGGNPNQSVGYIGLVDEVIGLFQTLLGVIWVPRFDPRYMSASQTLVSVFYTSVAAVLGIIMALLVISLNQLRHHWSQANKKLWFLLFGLIFTPLLAAFLLDVFFDKRMHQVRYLIHAGPALAVMVTYSISRRLETNQRSGVLLVAMLLIIQMTGINWGIQDPRSQLEDQYAKLAHDIKRESSPFQLVVTAGRWANTASVIYELNRLDPETQIIVVDQNSDIEDIWSTTQASVVENAMTSI